MMKKNLINRRFWANRGGYRRLLSIGISALLSVSTFLTVIPQTQTNVYAAGTGKKLQLGTGPLENGATVYYGSKTDAIKWKIIGFKGTGVASGSDNATLISSGLLGTTKFSASEGKYENSLLHTEINSILSGRFTDKEKADTVMPDRTLQGKTDRGEAYASGNSSYIWGSDRSGQKLWPLSTAEAKTLETNFPAIAGIGPIWWLRSPGNSDNFAAYVDGDGDVNYLGDNVSGSGGVRPAFNINLSSIILTSAAVGGKDPGTGGAGSLNLVDNTSSVTDWKVTIHDTSRDGDGKFKPERTDNVDLAAGKTLTISYSGAATGSDKEFVSVIITDADDTILYYGHIASTQSSASGTATINIPADAPGTMSKLYIFQEQCNGDYKTDYSSKLHDLTEPASKTPDSAVAVTGVSVSPTEVTLKPDATKKLTATVEPDDASNKDVTWKSDDENIATVSDDGTVTAKAEGETTITVKTVDGNKTATCKVIVKKDAPVVETCNISFDANGGKGDMDDQTVEKGVRTQLNANTFTRDGYTFDSWNTHADGKGKSYDDIDYITVEKDITLYAQWEKGKIRPRPRKHDDDESSSSEEASKPAVVNPDTVEGYFAVNGQPVPGVAMGKTVQGVAAQAVFNATRPAGFLQAFSFNMAVNGKVDYTLKNGVLTIIIPKEFQKAGRTFAIMALDKNGKAWTFADTDTNPATVTATINVEGYAFALIYKD